MAAIEDLLHRRTDLSAFVVHFTRDTPGTSAKDNLAGILRSCRLEARSTYGMGKPLADRFPAIADTQRTVCFTEVPLEHAWMMCQPIDGRSHQFNGYGLAFTRTFARRRGANPVWYLDITPGHDWLTEPIKQLIADAETSAKPITDDPFALAQHSANVTRRAPALQDHDARACRLPVGSGAHDRDARSHPGPGSVSAVTRIKLITRCTPLVRAHCIDRTCHAQRSQHNCTGKS
jgi:hypothetical protein